MGEGQRERETQNPKQALGSELSAQSLTWGSNSWAMRSWPEQESNAQPTEPARCTLDEGCPYIQGPSDHNTWIFSLLKLLLRGTLVAQSVKRPTSAQVMILWSVSLSPASGSVRTAQSMEPALDSVSPSLSAPPPLALCLCLSKMNKR